MTRAEVLAKLLALGALPFDRLLEITGWPRQDLFAQLRELRSRGALVMAHDAGNSVIYSLSASCGNPFAGAVRA